MRCSEKKILLVSNQYRNDKGIGNPIVYRILEATRKDERVERAEFNPFRNRISDFIDIRKESKKYDVVHIHFGGLYALLIFIFLIGVKSKKIITFHGTDIHAKSISTTKSYLSKLKIKLNQWASFFSITLFDKAGFVAKEMIDYVPRSILNSNKDKFFIQKLGVDYNTFNYIDKVKAQESLNLNKGNYILFSDISGSSIKRRDIAESIAKRIPNYNLLVMQGVKPDMVPLYINACDFLLLTSDQEGSPNIVRECLALNKPIFSVDVGDVKEQISGLIKSSIIPRDPDEAACVILNHLKLEEENTREKRNKTINIENTTREIIDLYFEQ